VVATAIRTNPQILAAEKNKDAADSAIQGAKGGYYPKIDVLLGSGDEWSRNTSTLLTTPGWVHLHRQEEGVVLNQMLWDGYGTKSEVDRRRAISSSSAFKVYSTAEDVALQAIDAYLDVIKNKALVGYSKENLQQHVKTYDQVKLRAEKGVGRRADLDQIEARLALAQSNVASAESTLRDSEISFLKVVGTMPVSLAKAPDPKGVPATVNEAVKRGLSDHPTLRSAQADIDAARAQREIARSFMSPRLEAEATYTNNENIDGTAGPRDSRKIMLWMKWNAFRGGFDKFRLQETNHQIDQASEIMHNTRRQVEAAVRLAFNAYATARDRLPNLERYVKSSNSTREAYHKQFSIGQRTLLDLLDSENEYFTARGKLIEGQTIELSAKYRVLNAMGELLSTLNIKAPEQAYVMKKK